jgi:hypothetical protein
MILPGFSTGREAIEIKPGTEEKILILMLRREAPRPLKITADKRESGITSLGDLPWGSHVCQFYRTKEEMLGTVVPYFKAGVENNEYCLWVTSEFVTREEALKAMENAIPGFSVYVTKGQMQIFLHTDWYLKDGKFDSQRTLDLAMEKYNKAFSLGFAGMRASGNLHWIHNTENWDDLTFYEAELNKVIGATNVLAICTYSLEQCSEAQVSDVIKNHQFVLGEN